MHNLYKRGSTWWIRFQVDGHERRRSLRTTSRTVAKQARDKILAELEQHKALGTTRHPWKEAVVAWAQASGAELRPATRTRYLCSLRQVSPILAELAVETIDRRTMAKIAGRPGVSNATRRRDLTAVSAVLAWCVQQGWRDDNPAAAWDRGTIKERRDPIVLPEESAIAAVVAAAPGNFARMILWARQTGMRQEEIGSLEHGQVDLQRRAVNLAHTKTRRARSVELSEAAVGTYVGTVRHITDPHVFWHKTPDGEAARYANISSRFAAIVRRVQAKQAREKVPQIKAFRFHDLRHLYAVEYLRAGGYIYDLQQNLGHTSIKTTEIYLDYLTPSEAKIVKGVGTKTGTVATV